MEKTNLVLEPEKVITSITNHSTIMDVRRGARLRPIEAHAERNVRTLGTIKGKKRFVQRE